MTEESLVADEKITKLSKETIKDLLDEVAQKEPITITAEYLITTPMFIGDTNQEATKISAPSVKGALRFWWRALNWGKVHSGAESDEAALKKLHYMEAELFGSAAYTTKATAGGKPIVGQGFFSLEVKNDDIVSLSKGELDKKYPLNRQANRKGKTIRVGAWQSYFLGLGLFENIKEPISGKGRINQYVRGAIDAGTQFTVICHITNNSRVQEVKDVLLLWGMLGGLGSRSRKGLGSVSIQSLTDEEVPSDPQSFKTKLESLLNQLSSNDSPFTALSKASSIQLSPSSQSKAWVQLGKIAEVQQMYRGWGYKSKFNSTHVINEKEAKHEAFASKQSDHDWLVDLAERIQHTKGKPNNKFDGLPSSIVFGLPRSYGVSSLTPKVDLTLEPLDKKSQSRSRRASPLFIHIHAFPSQSNHQSKTMIVQSFLPAQWMPEGDVIVVKKREKYGLDPKGEIFLTSLVQPSSQVDWSAIDEYLAEPLFANWEKVKL